MKKLFTLTLALGLFCLTEWPVNAQTQPTSQPSAEELEKQKEERQKNAYRLLDQVIDEAQSLRLTENRVRVQINSADVLWDQNQGRARSLFSMAADGIAEIGRSQPASPNRRFAPDSNAPPANARFFQLRQELVLAAARHDATLAYQLLAATKPAAAPPSATNTRRPVTSEESLEQSLLSRISALDPKLAAQNAEQMLDKGQFPMSLPQVISQLQKQDPDAAAKLADKTLKRIQATNLLATNEAGSLVHVLLRSGPRPEGDAAKQQTKGWPAVLDQSAYVDLLSTTVDAALKATPGQRGQGNPRTRTMVTAGPPRSTPGAQPTSAELEQANARRLLAGLQSVMPLVDQYLPAKAPLVRQKLTEMGMQTNLPMSLISGFSGDSTVDAMVRAAASAPQQMQSRIYQQAAYRALEEGDTERARQIATDHLQNNARDAVMKRIDFRELAKKGEEARFDEIRQAVARLQSDNEKIDLLLQVAGDVQKDNSKLALQLLDEARQITNRRATSYQHFEQQLKVARAYATNDPARSFEILDAGISHLNELLAAASVLSGFEMNMFRDGEMALQSGNGLTVMVNRFGQELALLARSDYERSDTLAGRFQFPEARIMTRMAIVQGLLDLKPSSSPGSFFGTESGVIFRQD